jgi:hypothetical protein
MAIGRTAYKIGRPGEDVVAAGSSQPLPHFRNFAALRLR